MSLFFRTVPLPAPEDYNTPARSPSVRHGAAGPRQLWRVTHLVSIQEGFRMRLRVPITLTVLFALGAGLAQAAGLKEKAVSIKDPAEVLPAKTLAYGEFRQPGQFLKEFADLFEGSVLGNLPDSLAK